MPRTVSRIVRLYRRESAPMQSGAMGSGCGKAYAARRALGAEGERQLALGREVALGRPEGRAGLVEVQRAQHVLVEEALLARHALRSCPSPSGPSSSCFAVARRRASLHDLGAARQPRSRKSVTFRLPPNCSLSARAPAVCGLPRGANSMELMTGATGYVGGRLIERLLAEGRPVRALARDAVAAAAARRRGGGRRRRARPAAGSREALDGCETAYYLVHSMEAADDPDFAARDRRAAENFAAAAHGGRRRARGLPRAASRRPTGAPSPHIASRIEVEEILLESAPVGHRAARLDPDRRALVLVPDARAAGRAAARAAAAGLAREPDPADRRARRDRVPRPHARRWPTRAGRSLDIAGPDVVSYGEMIERIAEAMGVGRMPRGARRSRSPLPPARW